MIFGRLQAGGTAEESGRRECGGGCESLLKSMNFVFKNDEFCIQNDGFCIKRDESYVGAARGE